MKQGCMRRFQAEGLNLERFMRLAGEQGVPMRRLRRFGRTVTGVAPEGLMPALAQLAAQGGWAFTPLEAVGWGRWRSRLRQRWPLCALVVLAFLCVAAALQWVWAVELVDVGSYAGDVRTFLEEQGIRPFIWKRKVDTAALRDALEWRYPRVAWVEVGWRGTALHIRLVEGTPKGDSVDWHGSRDVIASRDGVVTQVVVLAGTAKCKPGDTVRKGQVLIAGEERDGAETVRPVSARGPVTARVWDGARARVSLMETETVYTGAQAQRQVVTCPLFDLWREEPTGFAAADRHAAVQPLGGLFLPMWVRRETYLETQVRQVRRDMAQAQAEAGLAALRLLAAKAGRGDVFVDKWVDYCMIEGEILEAAAYGERRMDIGAYRAGENAS